MIKVTHENGYSGVLYGESSMSIYHDGKEVLHTGSRNVNTEQELYEQLDTMPELMTALAAIDFDDEDGDI